MKQRTESINNILNWNRLKETVTLLVRTFPFCNFFMDGKIQFILNGAALRRCLFLLLFFLFVCFFLFRFLHFIPQVIHISTNYSSDLFMYWVIVHKNKNKNKTTNTDENVPSVKYLNKSLFKQLNNFVKHWKCLLEW